MENQIFLHNKYTKWYYKIIDQAKIRSLINDYTEKHHIIPVSLAGTNDKSNIVKLTAREHFIVHKLLVKMTTGKNKSKMSFAFCQFFRKNPKNNGRLELYFTSRDYEYRKKLLMTATSKLHKGKTVSQETIHKFKETRRKNNKPCTEERKKRLSEIFKQKWENDYDKIYSAVHSTESRKKRSEANKGKDNVPKEKRQELTRGIKNGRARKILVTAPDGTTYHCHGNFQAFCEKYNLPFCSMNHILRKTRVFTKGATMGWSAEYESP